VERRRKATATGVYDCFCYIFSFYTVSHYIYFVSQKSVNDEERGGKCLLVPERSYCLPPAGSRGRAPGQGVWGQSPQQLKAFCFTFSLRHAQRSNALTDFDAWWLKMRGIRQGCAFLGLKYLMWCWLLAGKRLLKLLY